ncbi:hypothetical protein N8J89_36875 [Crossiella sp. CA-258035]|uniref:YciI family protein n=1 Tax=Crossiella sp. CA-258035 TaxID=2981138 RepID=UPI0024BC5BF6|nr:hypothetical protein [Crossiella sp. CA-258035]WHT18623.1 hypothetical protein N8J89_36875 [Crossiella sp. CA-258035]
MYIVLLNYTASTSEVDLVLPEHAAWLDRQYEAGHFLLSGRCRTMGTRHDRLIVTRPMLRGHLDAILATDPFKLRRVVRHEVIDFEASRTAPAFLAYNELLAS